MENIIFLDVDGVLNCIQTLKANNLERIFYGRNVKLGKDILIKGRLTYFDYEKLQILKNICLYTNAKIVFISVWSASRDYPLIEDYLVKIGLPIIDNIVDGYGRGMAIKKYLMDHDVDNFVILDDEIFAYYDEFLDHLVRTNFYNDGLTEELAEEAKIILSLKKGCKKQDGIL